MPTYQSFLLRCWSIAPGTTDEPAAWRFELQEVSAESPGHPSSDLAQVSPFVAAKLTALALDNDSEEVGTNPV